MFYDVSQCLQVFHDVLLCLTMLSESLNDRNRRISDSETTDRDYVAGIGDNSVEIGDNSAEISNNSAEIGDDAAEIGDDTQGSSISPRK